MEVARAEGRRQSVGRELLRLDGNHVKSGSSVNLLRVAPSGPAISPDRN